MRWTQACPLPLARPVSLAPYTSCASCEPQPGLVAPNLDMIRLYHCAMSLLVSCHNHVQPDPGGKTGPTLGSCSFTTRSAILSSSQLTELTST